MSRLRKSVDLKKLLVIVGIGGLLSPLMLFMTELAEAEKFDRLELGSGIGFVSGSPDGTRLAEIFTADWYVSREVSIGPMVQLVPPGDFTQVAGALVGRYHWEFSEDWKLVPFLGLGGLHSEVKRSTTSGGNIITTDTSYYVTVGLSLDWDITDQFGISGVYMNNMHDIRTGDSRDRDSSAFFFSLRFRPRF